MTNRKNIVAGNWKMNTLPEDGQKLAAEILGMVADEVNTQTEVIIAPPFTHLATIGKQIQGSRLQLAAQNCHYEPSGAYTGEVSIPMLKALHVKYVIIGHSERRAYFAETSEALAKKSTALLEAGLTPIFCCGETLEERQAGQHFNIISKQVAEGLFHLSVAQLKQVVIAYEPVWAIGTGVTASAAQAQEIHAFIRNEIAKQYNAELASSISILYGGSVKPDNAKELFGQADIDGGLIGGAALSSRGFTDIANAFN